MSNAPISPVPGAIVEGFRGTTSMSGWFDDDSARRVANLARVFAIISGADSPACEGWLRGVDSI